MGAYPNSPHHSKQALELAFCFGFDEEE